MKPTIRTLYGLGIVVLLAILAGDSVLVWNIALAVCLGMFLADYIWLTRRTEFEVDRSIDTNLPVDSIVKVGLRVTNHNSDLLAIEIHDHVPDAFAYNDLPHECELDAKETVSFHYRVRPTARGNNEFKQVEIRTRSLLGFWKKCLLLEAYTKVKVYPNFKTAAKFSLLAVDNKLGQLGVKVIQQRGEGLDFHQLREYRAGDTFRQIDWKATVRRHKLISQEYRDERDQQVVFMLDCGRRMRHKEAGGELLDQAINAMLVLSHIASKQGDAVGLVTTGGVERWIKPRKGSQTVNYLLEQCYDINSTNNPSDYLVAAKGLLQRQRRRSLVIILTNTRTEEQSELSKAIAILRKKHLVILADLQEAFLQDGMLREIESIDHAHQFHGTLAYLGERRRSHQQLKHAGAICFDTQAKDLPAKLVTEYLALKHSTSL